MKIQEKVINNKKYSKLKIESIINKILYDKNLIDKDVYEKMSLELEKLLFKEKKM